MYEATCQATANISRVFTTKYLLKVLLALALIEYISPQYIGFHHHHQQHNQDHHQHSRTRHHVSAARVKGLIYNKDGKFIYRPSRSNQAHIIVIDDRSPVTRTARNNNNSNNSRDAADSGGRSSDNKTAAASHEYASSLAPPNYPMMQLYHHPAAVAAAAAAAAAAAQLASANSIRAMYAPAAAVGSSVASPYGPSSPLANYDLPAAAAAPGGQLAAELQAASARLLRAHAAARLHHHHQQQQQQQLLPPPPLQFVATSRVTNPQVASPVDTYGYGLGTSQASYQDYSPSGEPTYGQPQSRVSSGGPYDGIIPATAATYHSMPVIEQRQRVVSPYDQGQPSYGPDDMRDQLHPAQDMASPFDEPLPPPSGGYSSMRNQPPSSAYGKSRRANSQVSTYPQDLDDAEGDHVDYYDAELRDQGRGQAGSSHERHGSHRQYVRPPSHSTMMIDSERAGGPGGSRGASAGPPSHYNDQGQTSRASIDESQTPIPGSIQSIKSQLRRASGAVESNVMLNNNNNNKPKPKQQQTNGGPGGPIGGGGGGGQLPPKTVNLSAPPHEHGQPMAGADHANTGAQGREPKSMQYWKQYQDQFDIVK